MKTVFVIASLTTLALAGTAGADDAAAPDAGGGGDGGGGAGAPAMDPAAPPADPAAGEATAAVRWPQNVIDRPLTLPKGVLLVGPDLIVSKILSVNLTTGATSSSTAESAYLTAGYGITDDLEVNTLTPTYGFTLNPNGSAKGPLDIGVGYKILRGAAGGKLELIARAVGGYDLAAEAARPLRIGVHVQYNVTPKVAVFSHDVGGGNLGLVIATAGDPKPIGLTVPVGVGFKATPALWVEADTSVIPNLKLKDGATVTIGDFTPLFVTGVYNVMERHLDLIGYAGFADLQNAGDTVFFGVGARYYAGSL